MAGLEVVVRPVVFPNIRPAPPRLCWRQRMIPTQGIAVISGSGGRLIDLPYSFSMSVSKQKTRQETKRLVDEERIYQVDEDGNINKNNYVDVERAKASRFDKGESKDPSDLGPVDPSDSGDADAVKYTYVEPESERSQRRDPRFRQGHKRYELRRQSDDPHMTITYVTPGAWGAGTGTPNSAAQVDGNFYDVDQRIVALNADLAEGKRIDSVTYTSVSMTFHFTDGTSQVIPLPVAVITYVGQWANSTPYTTGQMVSVPGVGLFQILVDHTTPPLPAAFDPNATDGSGNPLYSFWMPLYDINYDAAIFVPGTVQRSAGELMFQAIAGRTMKLVSGNAHAYAYLDVAIGAGTNIILAIEKNRTQIGTITFTAGATPDAGGGQPGAFNIPATIDFAEGDVYALRVTQSNNAAPSGLSVTLPFLRTDV